MASEAIKLPVIDFSSEDLKPGTPTWNSVKFEVRAALEEFGCFKAIYDKIPMEIRNAIFDSSKEFFDLPLENKERFSSNKPFRGYVNIEFFESMGIANSNSPEAVESITNIIWPQANTNFSKIVHSYSEHVSEFDKMLRRMVLESLGVEKYMDEQMDSTLYSVRIMKYKPPNNYDSKLLLPVHTDKNIMRILDQKQKGLGLQTKDGQWIEVDIPHNVFFVMIGDMLHAWTNGRLYSPYHRVMLAGNNPRYSIGHFSNPKPGSIVKAPDELVDEEHPLLYKPFESSGYHAFYGSEVGKNDQSTLKAYCGV